MAELEGDAVFFFALTTEDDLPQAADAVKEQILRFFQVFSREINALQQFTACVCEACTNVGQLRLKQVIHRGEVAVEQIDRFEKLVGLDVIVVHRMLKNTVPSNEYLMRKNIGWKLKMHGRTILELVGLRKKDDVASIVTDAP